MGTDVVLPRAFYERDVVTVARELLGKHVAVGDVTLRIVETEAYHARETACHAHRGRTRRNEDLFGPPGHAYVYLCYGIHHLLNFVAEAEGTAAGCLVRGAEIVSGEALVLARRKGKCDLIGPGKVGQALGIDTTWSGMPLDDRIRVLEGPSVSEGDVVRGPRVGIGYAQPEHQALPWRMQVARRRR